MRNVEYPSVALRPSKSPKKGDPLKIEETPMIAEPGVEESRPTEEAGKTEETESRGGILQEAGYLAKEEDLLVSAGKRIAEFMIPDSTGYLNPMEK